MDEHELANFRKILWRLKEHGVEFVLIGGLAAAVRGSPVGTLDVDVCAPMSEQNVIRILDALRDIRPRFRFRPDKMLVPDDPARLRGIRDLNLVTDIGILDVMGDLPGVGSYESLIDKSGVLDIGGFSCRVLDVPTLIASKRAAGRAKDMLNIWHLEAMLKADQKQFKLFDASGAPPNQAEES